jgi:hypothetical protein
MYKGWGAWRISILQIPALSRSSEQFESINESPNCGNYVENFEGEVIPGEP